MGPVAYNSQISTYVFYILFVFIGSMFFLNLFTGILYINFKANSKKLENQQLTQHQIEFIKISQVIFKDKPVFSFPPKSFLRIKASQITQSNAIRNFIYLLLILDTLILLTFRIWPYSNPIHHAITIVLALYILCSITSHGFYRFFDNSWRIYQFIVTCITLLDLILDAKYNWVQLYLSTRSN